MEEILEYDVLDQLGPEEAARWRATLEEDATRQPTGPEAEAQQKAQSEAYRAGLPPRTVSLVEKIAGPGPAAGQ